MKPPKAKKLYKKRRERDVMEMYLNGIVTSFATKFDALKEHSICRKSHRHPRRDLARAKRWRSLSIDSVNIDFVEFQYKALAKRSGVTVQDAF